MGNRLSGKVALVTGGARGQGEAEARCFVEEGARVFVADILKNEGEKLAAELGRAATFLDLDIAKEDDWARALELILGREGRIDVLVNNAAMTLIRPAAETTPEEFARVIQVNQVGVYLGYGLAHLADFYDCSHVLVLGRVMSGDGGHSVLESARAVLKAEFPELSDRLEFHTPDETSKRHGQAVAAASLPRVGGA